MTEYSANGYTAGDLSLIVSVTVPGTNVVLPVRKGSPGALLIAAAARWHREVEPLVVPGCWGYAFREIRGSTTELSNHASGTAVDLNAPLHPLGTEPDHNFTPAQIAAVRRIVDDAGGALRWGGDYGVLARGGVTGSRPDGMHVEVIGNEAACTAALPFMTVPAPEPAIPTTPQEDAMQVELRFFDDDGKPDPAGLNFRGSAPAEASGSSVLVDRAWVRWVSYWGTSSFRIVAWDDIKPLGEADPTRGWWELPASVRGFTVEGRRHDAGTQPAVSLLTRSKP